MNVDGSLNLDKIWNKSTFDESGLKGLVSLFIYFPFRLKTSLFGIVKGSLFKRFSRWIKQVVIFHGKIPESKICCLLVLLRTSELIKCLPTLWRSTKNSSLAFSSQSRAWRSYHSQLFNLFLNFPGHHSALIDDFRRSRAGRSHQYWCHHNCANLQESINGQS